MDRSHDAKFYHSYSSMLEQVTPSCISPSAKVVRVANMKV